MRMTTLRIAASAAVLAAVVSPATAKPVCLTCLFGAVSVQFTADEQEATVSLFVPTTGYSNTMRGTFTPDQVVFRDTQLAYKLSRTNLEMTRTIILINSPEHGQCKVQPTPERAF